MFHWMFLVAGSVCLNSCSLCQPAQVMEFVMSRNVTLVLFLRTGKSLCNLIEIDLEFHYLTR